MVSNIKICCILNYAPHYREEIYLKMEAELNCRFYFGDATEAKIKKLDYGLFKNQPEELKYIRLFSHFHWLRGSLKLCFKPYHSYLLTGDSYCLSTVAVLLLNKFIGKKTYFWSSAWSGKESKIKKIIKKLFFNLSDGVFLYGNYARNLMVKEGINEQKLHLIYNSLSYDKQKKLRPFIKKSDIYQNHYNNDFPTIVFIGRLTPQKKLHLLFDAQKIAVTEKKCFNIILIGNGAEKNQLQNYSEENNLNKFIWFYGSCYDELKIGELIYNADICVSPGNVGLTAIHSLTFGTPVITHDNFTHQRPEFEIIQPDKTGLFFKENDVNSLYQSINKWLKSYPAKTEDVIKNCYLLVNEKYNSQYQISTFKKVFKIK